MGKGKAFIPYVKPLENNDDDEFQSMIQKAGKDAGNRYEKIAMKQRASRLSSLDKTAADRCFIRHFINYEMSSEFSVYARHFLKQHFKDLKDFEEPWQYLDEAQRTDIRNAFNIRILNLMFNAARAGDEYSRLLIIILYKRFYKKEYNLLKRFKTITADEIFSISLDMDDNAMYSDARLLIMAELMGVRIDPDVDFIYCTLDEYYSESEDLDEEKMEFLEIDRDVFAECVETVVQWNEEHRKRNADITADVFFDTYKFVENCFQYNGYPGEYPFMCHFDDIPFGISLYARTLALLKKTWKGKEFSFEEVQKYSIMMFLADTVISISDYVDGLTSGILGIGEWDDEESKDNELENLDKQYGVGMEHTGAGKHAAKPEKAVPEKDERTDQCSEEEYRRELASSRQKMYEQEQKYQQLREQYQAAKRTITEQEGLIAKYKSDREELLALRRYVSRMENGTEKADISVSEMQKMIAGKKIIIVGGHINWINKLRDAYPDWIYVSMDNSRATEISIVEGIEHLYFFTDHISHSLYGRFLKAVRDKKIPFGYLHGLNLDSITEYIYYDLVGDAGSDADGE